MTKVTYIHGINESKATPKKKAEQRYIDYSAMTDGELRLVLMAEQLEIVAEYYGSDEHKALQTYLETAIQSGIHGSTVGAMIPGRNGQALAREIARARTMRRPAAGRLTTRRQGVNGGIITLQNCEELKDFQEDRFGLGWGTYVDTPESRACEEQNKNLTFLNEHLEGSAHHLLYEYVATQTNSTVNTKRVLHRNAVSTLAELTEVDRDNLRLWMRNGVLRNNIKFGAAPIQPEDVIDTLSTSGGSAGIGTPFLAMLPALLSAFAAAVGTAAALIAAMKQEKRQRMLLSAQGIGTPTFGPEQIDWYNGGTPANPGGPGLPGSSFLDGDNTPLILAGAAAFLLLK
jgi:hypothetical protein